MKHYDIIIVGAGASGVFLSYELTKLENRAKVLMIDKGAPLEKRQCPIKKGAKTCVKCSPCHPSFTCSDKIETLVCSDAALPFSLSVCAWTSDPASTRKHRARNSPAAMAEAYPISKL